MIFEQIKLKGGDNFSYIIGDEETHEVIIVDPSFNGEALTNLIQTRGLKVKYVVNTHSHSDHTYHNMVLASRFGAKIVAHKNSPSKKDLIVDDGDVLTIGSVTIHVIYTPGHSPDSICLFVDKIVLTGDTLFVGECGRTDTFGGSAQELYNSLFNKLMKLDDSVEVYPGHDYGPRPHSTIGLQKKTNYVLEKRTLAQFLEFMKT